MTRYEIDCSKCKQVKIVGSEGQRYCKPMMEGKKAVYIEPHAGTKEDPDIVKCQYFIRPGEGANNEH